MKLYRLLGLGKKDRQGSRKASSSSMPPAAATANAAADPSIRSSPSLDRELEEVFKSIDTDGDGRICLEELRAMLRLLGNSNPDDTELLGLLRAIDSDGDGFISLEEFIHANAGGGSGSGSDLRAAFQVFDIDGNGCISVDELHSVFHRMGDKITKGACRRMIKSVDSDGNGVVDFEEFKLMMAPSRDSLQPQEH